MKASDVIVVGGGIIGCAIAYTLAKEGLSVRLLEREEPGREASYAAAGMLAPQSEVMHEPSGPFFELCRASLQLYPDFVAEIEEVTGLPIEYRREGALFLAFDFAEGEVLAAAYERQKAIGLAVEDLTAQEVHEREPALSDAVQMALFLPDDHQVDNQQLMKALILAAQRRGVEILTGQLALGLMREGDRVVGVRTNHGAYTATWVINCAGAWAATVDPQRHPPLPVKPIRGQIVVLHARTPLLEHVVHSAHCYIVPRRDGRLFIGSTMEDVGYEKRVTADALLRLLAAARQILPAIERCTFVEAWAGFRPDTPDHLPILGEAEPGLLIATGHFRNGILLAPITARLIAELITSGQASRDLTPFHPHRF
ncbi:MAG: glycine oxidase ThiO [Blastocatellia bacterium]|nr:glycine oxidase ThiO [Blastocatellia bacterium]MCX7753289.1 glycine oxidase ThiO [Blastocatellia bacterium]MDW8168148.1 glycine oxidase ThiO [Acidobacteriota bacterium]MDW8257604.1 glycine oxidase ThiO [Acidobacteriota bacterium]